MIKPFPRWKYALLFVLVVLSSVYALPNWYGDKPAVQIFAGRGDDINPELIDQVDNWLEEAKISQYEVVKDSNQSVLVKLNDDAAQLQVKDILSQRVSNDMTVAMNLVPATPKWMKTIGADPLKLGLDLRGGVHFLVEVDVDGAMEQRIEGIQSDLRTFLRDEKLRYKGIRLRDERSLLIRFDGSDGVDSTLSKLRRQFPELEFKRGEDTDELLASFSASTLQTYRNYTVEQTMSTLRNRVNELGVAEALVQRHGANRIVVELPGIQDTARAKDILGKTATLEFRLVDSEHDVSRSLGARPPAGSELFYDTSGNPILLKKRVILTGDSIVGATTGNDSRDGRPTVNVRIAGAGVNLFKKMTRDNIGQPMATLYIESKTISKENEDGKIEQVTEVDRQVISVATIQSALGSQFQISGFSRSQAADLALLLRAGALPASVSIVEERTVGPSLGAENIQMGVKSIQVGLGCVVLFMMLYYSWFGFIANITLVMNLVMLLAMLSLVGATLTLPGIAGIVLTLGMAVDANVLIFERIREEMRNGLTPLACISSGFDRALSTIIDSNLTTLIVGMILFTVGTGPVKGFAVTLCLGIITSLITAVTGTKAIVHLFFGRSTKPLPVGI
ncbi:MAG: protein translocase subunit SecD [Legionellales bacterium]|nr:protein translocase subunit SecD [Legionellales bacterium]